MLGVTNEAYLTWINQTGSFARAESRAQCSVLVLDQYNVAHYAHDGFVERCVMEVPNASVYL